MTPKELEDRLNASEGLRGLKEQLESEIQFRSDDPAAFDPITIIMIVSIIVQVIIHCRQRRSDDDIISDIRDLRSIPPRRLIRLRRRLNRLWQDSCTQRPSFVGDQNPFLTAVYELAEKADPATLQELLALAGEQT